MLGVFLMRCECIFSEEGMRGELAFETEDAGLMVGCVGWKVKMFFKH